jgi:hypothetical protein
MHFIHTHIEIRAVAGLEKAMEVIEKYKLKFDIRTADVLVGDINILYLYL